MLELTVAQTRLLSADQDTAQRALRRIVVDTARASTLTAEQRAEWRERTEVWAAAAAEFARIRSRCCPRITTAWC